jgi:hypothetical protein
MAGQSGTPPPPPPPSPLSAIPPPVPGWTPPPSPPRTVSLDRLESLAVAWGRILGFLILFVGTLIAVAAGSVEASCFSSGGCSGFDGNWAWAAVLGRVLWTVGLFFLGGSSGLQLMYGLKAPTGGTPEEYRWVRGERWFNFIVLVLSLLLLFVLLSGILTFLPSLAAA